MDNSRHSALLKIDRLSKKYGTFEAVKGISLEVNKGEVFGFLGPNGAGKTTTIKCCAGLLRPTGGKITVSGYDIVSQSSQAKSVIGYVPDNPFLHDKLTGSEYTAFVARLFGVQNDTLTKRSDSLFKLFEMHDQKDQLIQGYSRGMRQKTAIIASLVHQPQLLMLDEPTASLDPRSARMVKDIIRLNKEQGRTVFLSTHVMEIAESLCDRIAIINKGKIQAVGTMEELRQMKSGSTLEDIFLEITGGNDPEVRNILEELSR